MLLFSDGQIESDPWRSASSTSHSKHLQLKHLAQSGFEFLQGLRFHNIDIQSIPAFDYIKSENVFPYRQNFLYCNLCPLALPLSPSISKKSLDLSYIHLTTRLIRTYFSLGDLSDSAAFKTLCWAAKRILQKQSHKHQRWSNYCPRPAGHSLLIQCGMKLTLFAPTANLCSPCPPQVPFYKALHSFISSMCRTSHLSLLTLVRLLEMHSSNLSWSL